MTMARRPTYIRPDSRHWSAIERYGSDYWIMRLFHAGVLIGDVMWFYEAGPYYPHARAGGVYHRFGAFDTLKNAKAKVEETAALA